MPFKKRWFPGFITVCFLGIFHPAFAQWEMQSTPNHPGLDDLARRGDTVVATITGEIYRSEDRGDHWHKVFEGYGMMENPADHALYVFGNANGNEVFRSTDFGQNWSYQFTLPFSGQLVPGFSLDTVLLVQSSVLARKTSSGWDTIFQIPGTISKAVKTGQHLWVASSIGAFHSPDAGVSWTQLNFSGSSLAVKGDTILFSYCTSDSYLSRTTDFGVSWETATFSNPRFCNIAATEDEFYSINPSDGDYNIYTSVNGLSDWDTLHQDTLQFKPRGFRKMGDKLLLSSPNGLPEQKNGHWYYRQFPRSVPFPSNGYKRLYAYGDTLLATNGFHGYSSDQGSSWTTSARGFMPLNIIRLNGFFGAIQNEDDMHFYVCADDGYFEWKAVPLSFHPQSLAQLHDTLYLAERDAGLRFIYRSVDGGNTWTLNGSARQGSLFALNGKLYMFGPDALEASTNGGLSWTVVKNLGFPVTNGAGLAIEEGDIYISNQVEHWVMRSSDGGLNFDTLSFPVQQGDWIAFRALGNWNFLHGYQDSLFVKGKDSNQWVHLPLPLPSNELSQVFYGALTASNSLFYISDYYGKIWRLKVSELGEVKGVVFKDDNQNNLQDPGEKGVPNVMLQAGTTGFFGVTDALGQYHITINRENDQVHPVTNFPYFFYTPSEWTAHLLDTTLYRFALQTNDTLTDLSVHLTSAGAFRPGFYNTIYISVSNVGSVPASGQLRLVLNPLLQLQSSTPMASAISGDTLFWHLDPLEPLSAPRVYQAEVKVLFASPGTLIPLETLAIQPLDVNPANNRDTLQGVMVSSFDPNDKMVRPEKILIDQITETAIEYTIRFQNTGNFPTDFVVLRDTLSPQIELPSLKILGASHPFRWSVENPNILVFSFNPLSLPPASQDPLASQGFVTFSIKLKPGATLGQEIDNTAHIYFDFNPDIVTNTVHTTVIETPKIIPPAPGHQISMYPNPANQWIHLEVPKASDQPGTLRIFQTNGQEVWSAPTLNASLDVKVSSLPPGVYWVYWRIGDQGFSDAFTILRR